MNSQVKKLKLLKLRAFTILEFYTVLFIVTILILIAIPEFTLILMREEREITLERLEAAIELARQEALLRGKGISICGTDNQKSCHPNNEWTLGFMVFEKQTEDSSKKIEILQTFPSLRYGRLHFDHFGNHLTVESNGMTHNVGTFTYCPLKVLKVKEKRSEADALIVNQAGRTYRPINKNSEGIYETSEGTPEAKPLTCR